MSRSSDTVQFTLHAVCCRVILCFRPVLDLQTAPLDHHEVMAEARVWSMMNGKRYSDLGACCFTDGDRQGTRPDPRPKTVFMQPVKGGGGQTRVTNNVPSLTECIRAGTWRDPNNVKYSLTTPRTAHPWHQIAIDSHQLTLVHGATTSRTYGPATRKTQLVERHI